MSLPPDLSVVDGAQQLHDWFGYWPSFHDGEILSLHLNRSGESSLSIRTWEMTNQMDVRNFYVTTKHVVVEFAFSGISDLELQDFSCQNVISGLSIEKIVEGFRLELEPCYGLAGTIDTESLRIRLSPGKPPS